MSKSNNNKGYILASKKITVGKDIKTNKLVFQYNPESMKYGRTANYSSIESPGMSYPLTQYISGGVREFTFDLLFTANPNANYKSVKNEVDAIVKARKFLLGLLPPEKNKRGFTKPPTFILKYGYFSRTYVLTSLEINDEIIDSMGRARKTIFTLGVRQVGN